MALGDAADGKVFETIGLEIWKREGRYFIRYDAGAHQIAIREDAISEAEAQQAMRDVTSATQVLFAVESRLRRAGIDPHVANVDTYSVGKG